MNCYTMCKNFYCVDRMDDRHKESFRKLVDYYSPSMNSKTMIGGRPSIVYNFEHHCLNLYKIISNIILDESIAYNKEDGLNQTELYILNLAVLFHAISIFKMNIMYICDYPKESANLVESWFRDSESMLSRECLLRVAERYALADIIRVHNDTTNDNSRVCDLSDLNKLKDEKAFEGGVIRTRLLAGVLRLANKLDFSSERLGNDDSEVQLRDMIENKKYPDESESEYIKAKRDFDKLHYVSHLDRSENRQKVILVIDDKYVEKKLNEGSYLADVEDLLIITYSDIENELMQIKTKVFDTYEAAHYVQIKEIVFKTSNSELENRLNERINLMNSGGFEKINVHESVDLSSNKKISLLSDEISNRLSKEIDDRNLLRFGHFRLDNHYCARDWIDTRELVETEKILSEMVRHIITHMSKHFPSTEMIVGVDLVGSLLAARIAFPFKKPMTYIIPDMKVQYNVKHDIVVGNIGQYDRVVIVVDSIVSGETLYDIIKKYKLEDKIVAVYTIFYRKCRGKMFLNDTILSKTYCLNDSFRAEIFDTNNCPYKPKKCKAKNSRVY